MAIDTSSELKADLHTFLKYGGFGRLETEVELWHDFGKNYRADFYLPEQDPPVIIEYDGIIGGKSAAGKKRGWSNVGHMSISSVVRDQWKTNTAQAMGYRIYRFSAPTISNSEAYVFLDRVLKVIRQT